MTIDAYLAELRRLLPRTARLRVLAEVREHLRDAASRERVAGLSPADAEMRATGEFGDVREVAARLAGELAVRETRLAAVLALGAVACFVFPFYVLPENALPPAPWAAMPHELVVLQRVTIGLWLAAGTLAAVSVVLAWSRWPRTATLALVATATAITGAGVASAVLSWRWLEHLSSRWVEQSPSTPALAIANVLALPIVVACVAAAWWTISSRRRLALAD